MFANIRRDTYDRPPVSHLAKGDFFKFLLLIPHPVSLEPKNTIFIHGDVFFAKLKTLLFWVRVVRKSKGCALVRREVFRGPVCSCVSTRTFARCLRLRKRETDKLKKPVQRRDSWKQKNHFAVSVLRTNTQQKLTSGLNASTPTLFSPTSI